MPQVTQKPLVQHKASTVFIRCPSYAWPLVSSGKVSEFRNALQTASRAAWGLRFCLPTFCVVYRHAGGAKHLDYRVMLLTGIRHEALGAITQEGLKRAGYEGVTALKEFRRDWSIQEHRAFQHLKKVWVYTVRPIEDGDIVLAGVALVNRLYGDHLKEASKQARTAPLSLAPPKGGKLKSGGRLR